MKMRRGYSRGLWVWIFLLLLVACQSEEEKLRARVQEYWQYRLKGDLVKAYEYEYPILKKKMDLNTYISSRHNPLARYRKAEILSIKFPEKDVAEVEMRFEIETLFSGAKKPFVTEFKRRERWVKVKGEWYHVPAQ